MSRDSFLENSTDISQIAPALQAPAADQGFQYSSSFTIDQCIGSFVDGDGIKYPETSFHYEIQIGFDTYEDMTSYLNHPQRSEIESSLNRMVQDQNYESLQQEMVRDGSDYYLEKGEAGPNSFTEGTVGDFGISFDDAIPAMNGTYDINISQMQVGESMAAANTCIPADLGPNDFAATPPPLQTTNAFKM